MPHVPGFLYKDAPGVPGLLESGDTEDDLDGQGGGEDLQEAGGDTDQDGGAQGLRGGQFGGVSQVADQDGGAPGGDQPGGPPDADQEGAVRPALVVVGEQIVGR